MGKVVELSKLQTMLQGFADKADARFLDATEVPEYNITKLTSAEEGYASSYKLMKGEGANAVQAGATINIPKDIFVQSVTGPHTCATADEPLTGMEVGDKYFTFAVSVAGADGEDEQIQYLYLNLKDMVNPYVGSYSIQIGQDNSISLKIDTTNANGLEVTSAGLKLNTASYTPGANEGDPTTYTNGAMTGQEKEKLADLEYATDQEITALLATIWPASQSQQSDPEQDPQP